MKIILRTTLLLLAALLVVGGLLALRQTALGSTILGGEVSRVEGLPDGFAEHEEGSFRPGHGGRGEHGDHADQGPSWVGFAEVGKNLGIIAASIALVSAGTWLVQRPRKA